jgi:hypothetical protein
MPGIKPEDLVEGAFREVECDDTMQQFKQVLRFDLVDILGEPLSAELLLDRRHKLQKSLSKPVAFFHMSAPSQLISLGVTSLAVSTVLVFAEQKHLEPTREEILKAVQGLLQLFVSRDLTNVVDVLLRDLRLHRSRAAQKRL